jgi:hypothetical protein
MIVVANGRCRFGRESGSDVARQLPEPDEAGGVRGDDAQQENGDYQRQYPLQHVDLRHPRELPHLSMLPRMTGLQ